MCGTQQEICDLVANLCASMLSYDTPEDRPSPTLVLKALDKISALIAEQDLVRHHFVFL